MKQMTMKEFFILLMTNFIVCIHNIVEFFRVSTRYYTHSRFFKIDISLMLMYLFHNPFSISKRFLMDRSAPDVYAYGETPLSTMEMIAKEAQIGPNDHVYELGCGRGRTCFWLHDFLGCSVVGIDYVPEFIERANRIKNKLQIKDVDFLCVDMCEMDYKDATVCYLYGTCLDDSSIQKLESRLSKLPVGTKIITVSYPLTDYTHHQTFEVMKRFTAPFPWGNTDVFIQIVKQLK